MENLEKELFVNSKITKVNSKDFFTNFKKSKKQLNNGELVDLHSEEDYKNTVNFLSKDKKSGFAVTKNGDLISVFNSSSKKGFLWSISKYVKSNVKTLDCYRSKNQNLEDIYKKVFNFKTASVLDFNYQLLVDLYGKKYTDNFVKIHGQAPVVFMVNTDKEVKTKHFTCNNYDKALAYRNSFV